MKSKITHPPHVSIIGMSDKLSLSIHNRRKINSFKMSSFNVTMLFTYNILTVNFVNGLHFVLVV